MLDGVALVREEVALSEAERNVTDVKGIMEDDVNAELIEATLLLGGFELTTTGTEEVVVGAAEVGGGA